MLSILVAGANNEEGLKEIREFEAFLNRAFRILYKQRVKCIKICYYKVKGTRINRTTTNRMFNNVNVSQKLYDSIPVTTQNSQQQTNLIHQANLFQGVNLIYAVDTN